MSDPSPGGRSLFHPLAEEQPVFSYMDYRGRRAAAVRWRTWKLIEPMSSGFSGGSELFDLEEDPRELDNVIEEHSVVAGYLASLIRAELARAQGLSVPEEEDLGEAERRALEALGYLH